MSAIETSDAWSDCDSQGTEGVGDMFSESLEGRESSGVASFSADDGDANSSREDCNKVRCFLVSIRRLWWLVEEFEDTGKGA